MIKHCASGCYEDGEFRKGPWMEEEDLMLVNYVSTHGEGRWNSLARLAGLRRTGKSCRLRWLNYLRPDVRRGNMSLQEQLLILQLHSRWGNRWSKIAQKLPGRTDNEIKNYWRTRVQKQAKQLKCDVNSQQFRDTMQNVWMPRLAERIEAASATPVSTVSNDTTQTAPKYYSSSDTTSCDAVSDNTHDLDLPRTVSESDFDDLALSWQELENVMWSDENVWFLQQQLCD